MSLLQLMEETLQQLDASQVSKMYTGLEATIAGHANHARYYLRNFLDFLQGKSEVEARYSEIMRFMSQRSDWQAENQLAGVIAMIAHTAYHLGAIRQLKEL